MIRGKNHEEKNTHELRKRRRTNKVKSTNELEQEGMSRVIDTLIYIVFLFVASSVEREKRRKRKKEKKNGWSTFFRVQVAAAIDVRQFLIFDLLSSNRSIPFPTDEKLEIERNAMT